MIEPLHANLAEHYLEASPGLHSRGECQLKLQLFSDHNNETFSNVPYRQKNVRCDITLVEMLPPRRI